MQDLQSVLWFAPQMYMEELLPFPTKNVFL